MAKDMKKDATDLSIEEKLKNTWRDRGSECGHCGTQSQYRNLQGGYRKVHAAVG